MTPANRNAEKYLQQVCSLGLRWQEVMPTIMDTLHHIVPSYGNCFFAANQQGDVVDIFDERPEAQSVTALYAEHFLNRKEKEVFIGWRNAGAFRSAVDFDRLLKVDRRQFMRHELYNEVLKPIGYYYGAHVVLRVGSELRGYLQVERGRKSGRYTAAELRRLDRAGAFIQYALGPAPVVDDDPLYSPDVNQQGMIVADRAGRIQHVSKTARQLLHLSCFSRVSEFGRTLQSVEASRLPPPIARLCHIVADIGNDKLVPEPPSHVLRNAWGEFHFRAYELESLGEHASNGLIGISLTWFKPMAAKILAAVKAYDLTTRQMQTCVLLIKGLTARDISKQLGVSESTVISHRKEIYGRMGVKNRSDLLNRLMAA